MSWLAAAAVVLLIPWCAVAQTSTLAGRVVDDSGAGLPGVVVVLTAAAGGNPRETTSDESGAFTFSNVSPGDARLRAELAGFLTLEMKVKLADGGKTDVIARMKVGFDEEITVSGDAGGSVLSPARNANAVEFDPEALRRLPSDAQDLQALVDKFATLSPSGGVSVVIDGIETDGLGTPASAIHRLIINRNPYAVEFRTAGKSRVEVETERGSRKFFHGSGAFFVRNSALDARNAFAASTPDISRALGEGTLSGPLVRKGWSFFAAAQRLMNDQAAIINAETAAGPINENVATPERRGTFLFRADFRPNKTDAITLRYDLFDDVVRDHGIGGFRLAEQAYTTTERRHRLQIGDRRVLSIGVLNDLKVEALLADRHDGLPSLAPAIVVAGAFTGGAPQTFSSDRTRSIQAQEIATITIRARVIRLGASVKVRSNAIRDAGNFGGTYQFRSLADFMSGAPFLFVRRSGDPDVSFAQADGSMFADTTFRPADTVGVTAGVRYDWQADVSDWNNVAPRISVSFAPARRKTVFRIGAGVFYQTISTAVFARARLFGEGGLRETAIPNPTFPATPPVPSAAAAAVVWTLAPDLRLPMTMQASASAERALWRRTSISAEYMRMRSSSMLRARDINAPLAGTGIRPDSSRLNVFQIDATGTRRTDALLLTFRGKLAEFKGTIEYTLSRTTDEASDPFDLPADSNDPGAERARADFDRRHRLDLAGAYGWKKDRVRLGAVLGIWSGAPYNIVLGTDANGDLVATDRPPGVGRNAGQGPGYAQLDLRFTTVFRAPRPHSSDPESAKREQTDNLELNLDVLNATNRVNPTTYVGVITSPLFGMANAARPARSAQISLRYRF